MFSIAAINDTDSKQKWEPLAPTKEAQEFHLTQTYHEGLLKFQSKEYDKARELLESVLKDPLLSEPQVDGNVSDGHLLQLRFLALKNLAAVFVQFGLDHYESALQCYLQAVEIDAKDSVVWNQLGTLSCSMGSLSISRWAFEQGLLCSPNNWSCMEKLLEVLIAIGDEVACLSVAELILRHWPSHSRALHVKATIEESEPVPFAPKGINKLEPKHVRLKFPKKRKASDENLDSDAASKRLNQSIEINLNEISWAALLDALLEILLVPDGRSLDGGHEKVYRSGHIRLALNIPADLDIVAPRETKRLNSFASSTSMSISDLDSDATDFVKDVLDEQPHERRSSRLERRRNPGKEEAEFGTSKDQAKVVLQFLEPFVLVGSRDFDHATNISVPNQADSFDEEHKSVCIFVRETSKNYGAYHMGHLLLEFTATTGLLYQDVVVKFLELEKLTRFWGQDRTADCSLFLAEIYYDMGSLPCNSSKQFEFMSEAFYHLCKIIESVALDFQFQSSSVSGNLSCSSGGSSQDNGETLKECSSLQDSFLNSSLLIDKSPFWVRYFWLSGKLSILDGNTTKADQEFCISLSILAKMGETSDTPFKVHLPHVKINKELTIDRVLHEINLLRVDHLLKKTVHDMIVKEMYVECIDLLAPLLFSTKHVYLDASLVPDADKKAEGCSFPELTALDTVIEACEKVNPVDIELYLKCHLRKLQILMVATGINDNELAHLKCELRPPFVSDTILKENPDKHWNYLVMVAEEVKGISLSLSQLKTSVDSSADSVDVIIPMDIVCRIQSSLLGVMCHISINYLSKTSCRPVVGDQTEQKLRVCFIDAAIAFCKLQHLIFNIPVKTQVELMVTMHDLLAEYGLCCMGEEGEGQEGTFLKFGIKHLLALDMKLKSNINSLSREIIQHDLRNSPSEKRIYKDEKKSDITDTSMGGTVVLENCAAKVSDNEGSASKSILSNECPEKENAVIECENQHSDESKNQQSKICEASGEGRGELTEDEKEELESLIDNALDQCFFCLYGLNIRSDSSYEDNLATHKNTSRGDYQTKEQCADVFRYILPYAKASSKTGLVKLRRVLRAIRKHFPRPTEEVLARNAIDRFLDDLHLCEEKLSEEPGSEGYLDTISKLIFPDAGSVKQHRALMRSSSEPYFDVYCDLYYFLALSEEMSATDKWPGFVLTKEGEEFVQQNANLFKYDLLYNPLRFESWQRLANIYDEEVDLLLNDGSKHINVAGWRKHAILPQRVETSRRRSRRCLLMSLALAKSSEQQCEIHELLALVYYDCIQNVVPFYDQRSAVPSRAAAWEVFCQNSLEHFKKAFSHKQDWSHAFYMGKLCEKLGYSYETSLSYYDKAIALNPSAVDPFYRMHASRLKLLWKCGEHDLEALKILSEYSFNESTKDSVMSIFDKLSPEVSHLQHNVTDGNSVENNEKRDLDLVRLAEVRHMLYNDCLSALEVCVEGDLKHFHRARYMLSKGLYKRGLAGDLEWAKDELSFCFKSSRSSFTINMWEIDSMVKKGRRKTPNVSGNRKALEVNLAESSRKFITSIRKYLLFYLVLLEEIGNVSTLDRACVSLRADKRFSLCVEDLVPVAFGRLIKALTSTMHQAGAAGNSASGSSNHHLEKLFSLFMDQGNLWLEILSSPEIRCSQLSESSLYGYLHTHIISLERNCKLESLEAVNERLRKRFKNPKLSNSSSAKVCRHASVAWCRSLIISLALITPLQTGLPDDIQAHNPSDGGLESKQLLFVNLRPDELWATEFEDAVNLENAKAKWNSLLPKVNNVIIKKASDENFETANSLLRSSYNFFRESSSVVLPSGVNLYLVPAQLAMEKHLHPGLDGVEHLDLSVPRKLLLWSYILLHGRYTNISAILKYCEEHIKSRVKKGAALAPSLPSSTTVHTDSGKDSAAIHSVGGQTESPLRTTAVMPAPTTASTSSPSLPEDENAQLKNPLPPSVESP